MSSAVAADVLLIDPGVGLVGSAAVFDALLVSVEDGHGLAGVGAVPGDLAAEDPAAKHRKLIELLSHECFSLVSGTTKLCRVAVTR